VGGRRLLLISDGDGNVDGRKVEEEEGGNFFFFWGGEFGAGMVAKHLYSIMT
jgi:hypothetical protein